MRSEEEFTFLRLRERNPVFFLFFVAERERGIVSGGFYRRVRDALGTKGCSGLLRTES
jgi:hypothetical protein